MIKQLIATTTKGTCQLQWDRWSSVSTLPKLDFTAKVGSVFNRFFCVFVPEAFRTFSGLAPPLIHGPAHFPQPYSLPPRSCYPAVASMRPPPSTTHQRGRCTISMTKAVSQRR